MSRLVFTWKREKEYRAVLNRIARSPETRLIARREFDDLQRVLKVLVSKRLFETLTSQLEPLHLPIREIALERALVQMAGLERILVERFAGCDANKCLLLDTLDIGFSNEKPTPAIASMFSDRLLVCQMNEVALGDNFPRERDLIHAELVAAGIRDRTNR